jgi:predicted phosphodiesterase
LVRIELVGGPLDGKTIRILYGLPKRDYEEPEVVEVDGRKVYQLHGYRLGVNKDGLPAYHFRATASFV